VSTFEDFAQAQLPRLLRYAVMLTGERHLAADLVQDVLVKAFERWSQIAQADRPDRYVLTMVTNQYLSWRRRWAVRSMVTVADVPDRVGDQPIESAYAARDDMWRRLAGLPRRQRAVLVLRYYEQLADGEIAEVLGCSPGTVRGHASRALAALRADLVAELATTEEMS